VQACWAAHGHGELPAALARDLRQISHLSPFVEAQIVKDPEWFHAAWHQDALTKSPTPLAMARRLAERIPTDADTDAVMRTLRVFRTQTLACICWRQLLYQTPVEQIMQDTSRLAGILIRAAQHHAQTLAERRYGTFLGVDQSPVHLLTLAMGKLGGGELNISSDIDLMFAFRCDGMSTGPRRIPGDEYFSRLARNLVRLLGKATADGVVYRVDTRLRPHGKVGRLALSFNACENYYQREGRDWERYALIKMYPIAGDAADGRCLLGLLRPFVYRRYVDYSTLAAIRKMRQYLRREHTDVRLADNIKLGPGGIRDLEFLVQTRQLVRGGRNALLRQRPLLRALSAATTSGEFTADAAEALNAAYLFLRRLENCLQAYGDQQTHQFPIDLDSRLRLAQAMGVTNPETLVLLLQQHRRRVQQQCQLLFGGEPMDSQATSPWVDLWNGEWKRDEMAKKLRPQSIFNAGDLCHEVTRVKTSPLYRMAGTTGRERIDRFMPLLLQSLADRPGNNRTLRRMTRLVLAVARRSAYLIMLVENPSLLNHLLRVFEHSEVLAEEVIQYPLLLDDLLSANQGLTGDAFTTPSPPVRPITTSEDSEAILLSLAEHRRSSAFAIALQFLLATARADEVSQALTTLAEQVVQRILTLAWSTLQHRNGLPADPRMAIIGYGKLGGSNLGFGSDLDLVCMHADSSQNATTTGPVVIPDTLFYRRLVLRLQHWLSTATAAGKLYTVDLRLRPDGSSGLLVTSASAYANYQQRRAWTWENQALVHARCIAGDADLAAHFEATRHSVLTRKRESARLVSDIMDMRRRQLSAAERQGETALLKRGRGGMADVEFMAQYLVLRYAYQVPELIEPRTPADIIGAAAQFGVLDAQLAADLTAAYTALRTFAHKIELGIACGHAERGDLARVRSQVSRHWETMFCRDKRCRV